MKDEEFAKPDYYFSPMFEATVYFDVPDFNDDIQNVFDMLCSIETSSKNNELTEIQCEYGDASPASYPWVTIRGCDAGAVRKAAEAVVERVRHLGGRLNP